MARSMDIAIGQSAELPGGFLGARLTGSTENVRIEAYDAGGRTMGETDGSRASALTLQPGAGSARIRVRPAEGVYFGPRTRVGLQVHISAGAGDSPQVLISELDVGGYRAPVLARVDGVDSGWLVHAGDVDAGGAGEPFGFLLDEPAETHAPWIPPVDEREHQWIGEGRYALRLARDGSSDHRPTATDWALVVDSSASMRSLVEPEELASILELAAGVLVEETGRLPRACGITGALRPTWATIGQDGPRRLAAEALGGAPSTWTLAIPALSHLADRGIGMVLFVTDSASSDLAAVRAHLDRRPADSLRYVVLSRSDSAMAEPGTVPQADVAHVAAEVAGAERVRVAGLALAESDAGSAVRLAADLVKESS